MVLRKFQIVVAVCLQRTAWMTNDNMCAIALNNGLSDVKTRRGLGGILAPLQLLISTGVGGERCKPRRLIARAAQAHSLGARRRRV